jgi:hypothetical protein
MYKRILTRFREKICARRYVLTLHAEEEMIADGFTVYDVEQGILTGTVVERQRDRQTAEWKYRLRGRTHDGDLIELLAKEGPTGKVVILTVYAP